MIKNIVVTGRSDMDMHRSNSGENKLGNESAIKKRSDGRVYISGQMVRHAFFQALKRVDGSDDTFVSNGDGTTYQIERDLRSDIGGFMLPGINGDAGRRSSPLDAVPAVAEQPSDTISDLLLRLNRESEGNNLDDHNIVKQEVSEEDTMYFGLELNLLRLSTTERFSYDSEMHVETEVVRHCTSGEKKRRALLFLEAANKLNNFSSQARNASDLEPFEVLIVLDTKISGKPLKFFKHNTTENEKDVILNDLDSRGSEWFYGNDREEDEDDVREVFQKASKVLGSQKIGYDKEVIDEELNYEETFPNVEF